MVSFADTRLLICNNCEHLKPLKICGLCGCFIPAKVQLKSSYCPATPPKWISLNERKDDQSASGCGC